MRALIVPRVPNENVIRLDRHRRVDEKSSGCPIVLVCNPTTRGGSFTGGSTSRREASRFVAGTVPVGEKNKKNDRQRECKFVIFFHSFFNLLHDTYLYHGHA